MVIDSADSPSRLIDVLTRRAAGQARVPFADTVRFRSPFTDYQGRETVAGLVELIRQVLDEVHIDVQLSNATTTMSTFTAKVGEEPIQGVLVERDDDMGRLEEAMLTVRPYRGLRSAMAAMERLMSQSPVFNQIQADE
jgi:hypothetical protein